MIENMDEFYRELTGRANEKFSLTPASKTIVLFRVAIETGAKELGLPRVVYLLSRLLMISSNTEGLCGTSEGTGL